MTQYIIKRLLLMVVTLFGIILITFAVTRLAPGDPAKMKAQSTAAQSDRALQEEALALTRQIYGLDKPIFLNFEFEERAWFIGDILRRATMPLDKSFERGMSRRQLRKLSTVAYPELIPMLPTLEGEALKVALEGLATSAIHTLPPGLAGKPEAEQVAYWTKFWESFIPDGVRWQDHVAATVEKAMTGTDPEAVKEVLRLGPLTSGPLVRRLLKADESASISRALYLLGEVERTPGWVPEPRLIRELMTSHYLPANPRARAELKTNFYTARDAAIDAALSADESGRRAALSAVASFWNLPVLLEAFFKSQDPALKADLWAGMEAALTEEARSSIPEAAQFAHWPELDRLFSAVAREKTKLIKAWWGREHFHYEDYGFVRHAYHAFTNTQFGVWMGKLIRFDFDTSFRFNRPVLDLIAERLPITLTLSFLSFILAYSIAIPLGIYSSTHYHSFGDKASTLVLFILYSLPSFWVGEMLIIYLSNPRYLDIFPSHGIGNPDIVFSDGAWTYLKDRAWHLILPVTCFTYSSFSFLSRQMRSSMLETIRQDFIRTARAKGLPNFLVVYKHALRNSLIPILTLAADLLPSLISGAVILETVFSIDGMGKLAVEAVFHRDYPIINAIAVFSALLTLLGILISDLSYALVDPRITYE